MRAIEAVEGQYPALCVGHIRTFMGTVELINGTRLQVIAGRMADGVFVAVLRKGAGAYEREIATADVTRDFPTLAASDRHELARLINSQLHHHREDT